jgi:hypothetical protein
MLMAGLSLRYQANTVKKMRVLPFHYLGSQTILIGEYSWVSLKLRPLLFENL